MAKIPSMVLISVVCVVSAFAIGNLSGLYFYPKLVGLAGSSSEHDHPHPDENEGDPDDHIALTKQAYQNLNLKMGLVRPREYWKSRTIPGEVIEVPGMSELSVPAPTAGVVDEVFVRQGQSLAADELLVSLRITDEGLTQSQSKLLATLARQEVVREEIARLEPLTRSGTVSGRLKRDLEYELKQLVAEQDTRMQEIIARGLPTSVLKSIVESRSLAEKLSIVLPRFTTSFVTQEVSVNSEPSVPKEYSVEQLLVHPGKAVQRGETLCRLSFHSDLQVRGTAFESDLPALKRLTAEGWQISVEFGHVQHEGHSHRLKRGGLELLHINNHVDPGTQTFNFFAALENEVEESITDKDGRTYLQWKFKPGQRVHLSLPVERWEEQLVLPTDAVAIEGHDAIVFVEHVHEVDHSDEHDHDNGRDHDHHRTHDHGHEDAQHVDEQEQVFIELEPVPVRVLHRDLESVVVANDGQIHPEDRLALNGAFKLHLAMKMQAGGGAAHDHDH